MTGQRGFSLTEVLVTVLVASAIIAMVVPTMTNASRSLKLMTVAKEIEGQLQNTRFTAINKNRSTSLVFSSDGSWYFLDLDGNGVLNGSETALWAPSGGYTLNASAPTTSLTASVVGTSQEPAIFSNRGVAFTSRGSVVQVNSSQVPTTTKLAAPGVIYLRDPQGRYAAVSLTSAGRVRSWTLKGTTWR
jgi:prepilin-type N-terminal cleavage/methylation domain-containing protein